MKKAQETKTSMSKSFLFLGPPGSGKTTLATQFPGCYLLNIDNNIEGPIKWLRKNKLSTSFLYDDIVLCDSREELLEMGMKNLPENLSSFSIPREWRARRLFYLLEKNVPNKEVETVVIDSLTALADILLDEVRRQQGLSLGKIGSLKTLDDPLQIQHWGSFFGLIKNLIFTLQSYGKTLILTGHTNAENDTSDGSFKEFIAIPGKMKDIIAGYFAEVWLFEIETEREKDGSLSYKRNIRTIPGKKTQSSLGLKSASGLEPKLPVDIKKIFNLLSA